VKTSKSHIVKKSKSVSKLNPFDQLIEDKKKIAEAFHENRPLSSLGISFVKPL